MNLIEFRDSAAVLPLKSGDIADELVLVSASGDPDGGTARKVNAPGGGIDRNVIKIFRGAAGRGYRNL